MGFRPKRRTLKIRFASDHPLHGLEIEAKSASLGEMLDLGLRVPDEEFIKYITSWNLDDEDGQPMEISVESLRTLDVVYVRDIKTTWIDMMTGTVSGPLDESSNAGEPSEATRVEQSIPMAIQ